MTMMKIAIGSDHAGFQYKQRISARLAELGHEVVDFGTFSPQSCDYPEFIRPAAMAVARAQCQRGIVLGGSGNGEAIVSNRLKGIRCAVCWDARSAILARQHNDANMISIEQALEIVDLFLVTPFEAGRHERRVRMIDEEG